MFSLNVPLYFHISLSTRSPCFLRILSQNILGFLLMQCLWKGMSLSTIPLSHSGSTFVNIVFYFTIFREILFMCISRKIHRPYLFFLQIYFSKPEMWHGGSHWCSTFTPLRLEGPCLSDSDSCRHPPPCLTFYESLIQVSLDTSHLLLPSVNLSIKPLSIISHLKLISLIDFFWLDFR